MRKKEKKWEMGWDKAFGVCSSWGGACGSRREQNGEQNYLPNKPRKKKKKEI